MDDIVPAAPKRDEIVDTPPRAMTTPREDPPREEISIDVSADVNAPPLEEMRREDTQISADATDPAPPAPPKPPVMVRMQTVCQQVVDELRRKQTYIDCLDTCFFFFFCHAISSVLLSITICCRCCTSMLKMPDRIEKRTAHTHTVFAFFAKNLSALWVSALLILFARWVLFRPIDVKPRLAASNVQGFELTAMGDLRFNVTAYVLFHNGHRFYKIHYNHFAGTVMYADVRLGPADHDELPSFRQKPHESTMKLLPFVGRLRNASGTVGETFARETVEGQLQMLVRIRVSLYYGFWPFKGDYFTIYDCPLHSPFPRMADPAFSSPARCNTVHF
uniref:Uncharacterized protein n=1 Tax=Avena sativa TaxID=4498 RepID=A0ACD5ZXR0_AVESA